MDFLYYANTTTKMPHAIGCHSPAEDTAKLHANINSEDHYHNQQQQQQQQSVPAAADTYNAYADNFDLSLLPQECGSSLSSTAPSAASNHNAAATETTNNNHEPNIPTTVYQYTNDLPTQRGPLTPPSSSPTGARSPGGAATPQIKIEQTWPCNIDAIKQEPTTYSMLFQEHATYFQQQSDQQQQQQQQHQHHHQHHQQQQALSSSPHQLIPPPLAYRQPYPSPQSSPAQSEYGFPNSHFAGCYDSLSSSRSSLYHPASPCPSLDIASVGSLNGGSGGGVGALHICSIKQEQLHILPPSPPESSCEAASPRSTCADIKSEPFDPDVETLIDLNSLFERTFNELASMRDAQQGTDQQAGRGQQQQQAFLLDSNAGSGESAFPKRSHTLDAFIGDFGVEVGGNMEPVISLALEHAKREADETCAKLQISQDPSVWSPSQVHAWLLSTIGQFELPPIDELQSKFAEDGAAFILLSEEEFTRRAPESGSILHAQLEIWKMAYSDSFYRTASTGISHIMDTHSSNNTNSNNNSSQQEQPAAATTSKADEQVATASLQFDRDYRPNAETMDTESDDDDEELPSSAQAAAPAPAVVAAATSPVAGTPTAPPTAEVKPKTGRSGGSHIHLWQFLKELLAAPHFNGTAIRWIDRNKGIFKIEDSVRVAKLWGRRKNRPAMNYDKLSRSIRQYYKKGIMKKTERSQRLVYQFCAPYHL